MSVLFSQLQTGSMRDELEVLLQHGCLWPTDNNILRLFKSVRNHTVLNKLGDRVHQERVSNEVLVADIIRGTPQAKLAPGHLRMYYEFGGFAAERQALIFAGLIKSDKAGWVALTGKAHELCVQQADVQDIRVLEECGKIAPGLQTWISERVRKYELERCRTRALFRLMHSSS